MKISGAPDHVLVPSLTILSRSATVKAKARPEYASVSASFLKI
jgi:hypothetical protein